MKGHLKRHLQSVVECRPTNSNTSRETLLQQLLRNIKGEQTVCENCSKNISKANYARHKTLCKTKQQSASLSTVDQTLCRPKDKQNIIKEFDQEKVVVASPKKKKHKFRKG
jgi:hypothetical protein